MSDGETTESSNQTNSGILVPSAIALGIFALSWVIRQSVMNAGFTLDVDESQMVNIVQFNDWPAMLNAVREDGNPVLGYVLMKLWSMIFGTSDFAFKSFGIAVSSAIPASVYLLFSKRMGLKLALVPALLCAVCPSLIDITTRARAYGLMVLFGTLSIGWLARVWEEPENLKRQIIYGAVTAAAVASHLSASVIVFGELFAIACLIISEPNKAQRFKALLVSGLVALVLFLPLLEPAIYGVTHQAQPWRGGVAFPSNLYIIPAFVMGFTPNWQLVVLSGVFIATLFGGLIRMQSLNKAAPLLQPRIWVLSLVGAVITEAFVSTYMLRAAYVIFLVVPVIVVFVMMFLPGPTRAGKLLLLLPLALFLLWVPQIPDIKHRNTMECAKIFRGINEAAVPGKTLVVISPAWYVPVCYRYLDPKIEFVSFPDVAREPYLRWAGYIKRTEDLTNSEKLHSLIQNRLDQGWAIYHVELNPSGVKPTALIIRASHMFDTEAFLKEHAHPVKEGHVLAVCAPYIADDMTIIQYVK